jgi:hypothetical protein
MSAPTEVGHLRGMGDTTIGAALSFGGERSRFYSVWHNQGYEDWLIDEVVISASAALSIVARHETDVPLARCSVGQVSVIRSSSADDHF